MHTDPLTLKLAERPHEEIRKSSMSEGQKQTAVDPKTCPQHEGRPQELPHELETYLTTTNRPYEVLETLRDSRDHRLRLLLRRFTNQIQYGCKNTSCDVTTCLSYRRKHATTPLRPYSDVAARALAWRCVEQYAESGRAHAISEGLYAKRRGVRKPSSSNCGIELCWSDPVVPWYEDPSQSGRWRMIRQERDSTERDAGQPQGFHVRPRTSSNGYIVIPKGIQKSNKNGEILKQYPKFQPTENYVETLEQASLLSESAGIDDNPGIGKATESAGRADGQRRVTFAEPVEDLASPKQNAAKDTASFTQTLHDTSSIREFDQVDFIQHHVSDPPSFDHLDDLLAQDKTSTNSSKMGNTHPDVKPLTTQVLTFKILTLSTILWLRSKMPYDVYASPHRDLNTTIHHGAYSVFARQSLHYCLSDPRILLKSASTWHFIHPQPFKIDEEVRAKMILELAAKEAVTLRSSDKPCIGRPGGVMIAFGMLIAITSIPEILNHLFAALQHSYILPSYLNRIRHVDSQSGKSRRVERRSSGKQAAPRAIAHLIPDVEVTQEPPPQYIDDDEVTQLCMLVILTLQLVLSIKPLPLALLRFKPLKDFGDHFARARNSGVVFPYASLLKAWGKDLNSRPNYQAFISRHDIMDELSFQRLLDSFADVISHRIAIAEIQKNNKEAGLTSLRGVSLVDSIINEICEASDKGDPVVHKQALQKILIDLLKSVLLRRWDRQAIVQRRGPVGGALSLLAAMYRQMERLELTIFDFQWEFIADAFDEIEMPVKWLEFREDNVQTHMLSYSFLFKPASLVTYFRAINANLMKRRYDSATSVHKHAAKFLHKSGIPVYGAEELLSDIRPNMAKFFVLTIRRSNMLQDAMNQLWRRQRQEVLRPLKVRLGKDEGEDGLDHGGVQAEFFRIVFAEALDPDYGMFTTDSRTRMTWFQPGSLEPLYKFEALGILMSLAIYNGTTLPITFPLAFYRKILGLKNKTLQHIKDGWPDLTRGLQHLLDWNDGDVGDVIARTYEFSYDAFGASYTVDMTKVRHDDSWPASRGKKVRTSSLISDITRGKRPSWHENGNSSSSQNPHDQAHSPLSQPTDESTVPKQASLSPRSLSPNIPAMDSEAPLVTNANRDQYVKDYIYWLTHKSIEPQFTAFLTGFYTCLDKTALSIFTPDHLRVLIEGYHHIDIDGLQATATYDEYRSTDDIIKWFWQVVRDMSPDQHRHLLEFVTASDRVPVNGIRTIVFIVQRNGEGDERLPSSSTCYGRLLLPRYSSKEILRAKLEKAIENSVGFGSL